jgi:hypothetical protein
MPTSFISDNSYLVYWFDLETWICELAANPRASVDKDLPGRCTAMRVGRWISIPFCLLALTVVVMAGWDQLEGNRRLEVNEDRNLRYMQMGEE